MGSTAIPPCADLTRMLRLHADSRPDTLARIRRQVRHATLQTPLTREAAEDLELAAGEVLSNVHRHAYPFGVGPVFVEVFRTPRSVTVVVIDRGEAAAPPRVPAVPPRHFRRGGRGLYLASLLTDELAFSLGPFGHGLGVRMTKRIIGPIPLQRAVQA